MPARTTGVVSFPPVIPQNPFQRLFYEALAPHGFAVRDGDLKLRWLLRHRREVRVLHFHWPQNYYRHAPRPQGLVTWLKLALFAVRLAAARALGYRIAWTVHEVYPLNTASRRVDEIGSALLARFSHVMMANDRETADFARAELGRSADKIEIVPHSSYDGAYPPGRDRATMRAELGIDDDTFVFLLFGHVTVYKRVQWFVDAFRAAELPNAALVVAGLVQDEPSADAVRAAAAADDRIKPVLEFIPDERVTELYGAADAAVCPRQDGGTSGALVLALTLGVPVLAADHPTYTDVTGRDAAAWLFTPEGEASVTAAFEAASRHPETAAAKGTAGRRLVAPLSWGSMGTRAAELLGAALAASDDLPPVIASEHA
jgi:beta-1,4-mannosyltransferase